MKKYSQRTLPIQSMGLAGKCPVCGAEYRLKVETGKEYLFVHSESDICPEAKSGLEIVVSK